MRIHLIAAARPNFMKIAPLYHALKKEPWAEPVIVHTERPITIDQGTNCLCTLDNLEDHVADVLAGKSSKAIKIDLWDGQTAGRVVEPIKKFMLEG